MNLNLPSNRFKKAAKANNSFIFQIRSKRFLLGCRKEAGEESRIPLISIFGELTWQQS
jgi:hypothetical protein